jgi:hypothetical protein
MIEVETRHAASLLKVTLLLRCSLSVSQYIHEHRSPSG